MNKVANVVLGCGNVPIGKHIVNYTRNVDVINGVADAYNKGKLLLLTLMHQTAELYQLILQGLLKIQT